VLLRSFALPLLATVVGIAAVGIIGGAGDAGVVAVLAVLEVSLSFDNAIVNAKILGRMDATWQRLFLTVGVLIAVVGMRLVFPLVIVGVTGHLSPVRAVQLATSHPHEYAETLTAAHPAIASFGGTFLLMLFLDFVLTRHEVQWLGPLERALARIGRFGNLAAVLTLLLLVVTATTYGADHAYQVLLAGASGLAAYLAVNGLSSLFEAGPGTQGGLAAFVYLEVLDSSFSFDAVVGAFAITEKIFVIAVGLGIGAAYIRGLTVQVVRSGALARYPYLEHGAHWAIGALAVTLFVSISHAVPEAVTGLLGVGFIAASVLSSVRRNRQRQ
jgi:hypothetical protein